MYNNPMYYNNFYPYGNTNILKKGISLFNIKNINWSNILNNTQKTLNVINQAIPVYYQVKPIWSNAKTIFRMANAIKNDDTTTINVNEKNTDSKGPVFYI